MTVNLSRGRRAAVMAAVVLAGTGIGGAVGFYTLTRPVVAIQDESEADGVAIRGGWLELTITSTTERDCPVHIDRWFWRPRDLAKPLGDRDWVPIPNVGRPPPVIGVQNSFHLWIPIPGNIPADNWHYFRRSRDQCTSRLSFASAPRDSKDILVKITDPTSAAPAQIVTPPGPVTITPLAN